MKKIIYIIALLIAATCTHAFATINLANATNTINDILNKYIQSDEPGCSIVVSDGVQSHFSSKGLGSLEYDTSLSPDTKMLTASTSKQFLGYAVLQLVKQGKLNLDDDLGKHIPEFKRYADIKLYQLLNHTSGVKSHWAIFELMGKSLFDEYKRNLVAETLKSANIDFESNSRYLYSNGGYFLLTKVVESVTKKPFSKYMKQNIFTVLGMTSTEYLDDYKRIINNRADGYMMNESDEFVAIRTHSEIVGPGHIVTTARDFSKWSNHLLSINLERFFEPLIPFSKSIDGGVVNYYAGLFRERLNGDLVYQHAGYYENWRQGFNLYPKKKLAIVSLCNRSDISTNKMNYEIAAALLNWKHSDKGRSENKSNVKNKNNLLKSFEATYFNKALNEIIDIRFYKGHLYYVSPANSAYAKLTYDETNHLYRGIEFKQSSTFSFSKNNIEFKSPILSGKFKKLYFEKSGGFNTKTLGKYTSEDGFGAITLSKSKKGILIELEDIGEIEYLHTKGNLWVDQENLSTILISEQDDKFKLILSLKDIKNLSFTKISIVVAK
jgi:CubicO group peptidase (beta-lactamase class C family)